MQALKWDLCPMTSNSWLNVFLQLVNLENSLDDKDNNDSFVLPAYSPHAFIQIARVSILATERILNKLQMIRAVLITFFWSWVYITSFCIKPYNIIFLLHQFCLQLLDLCHLDIGCLQFNYSVLAAAAMYHMSSADVALSVSGVY